MAPEKRPVPTKLGAMNSKLFEQRAARLRDATAIAIFRMHSAEHAIQGIAAAVRGGFEAGKSVV